MKDLSQMSNITRENLFMSNFSHKSLIEVNETGTGSFKHENSLESFSYQVEFICNRPFLFLIHDKGYENVFFVGKFFKPDSMNIQNLA